MDNKPRIFVISGPPGVGKGTLVAKVRERLSYLDLTVSCTTRTPRKGEVEGVSYYFISDEQFDALVSKDAFLEWAWVHDHRYGTLKSEVDSRLAQGHSVILEIDVQGGFHVRELYPEALLIFLLPPSLEELKKRMIGRGSETAESLEIRLATAVRELACAHRYDVRIVNDDLDRALDCLETVITTAAMA